MNLRSKFVDIFALVVFCSVTGMFIEVVISGMTVSQSLSSRLLAIPTNMLIAVPYAWYRDQVMDQVTRRLSGSVVKMLADVFAFVTFQAPIYGLTLLIVGVSVEQMVTAVSTVAMFSVVLGAMYGYFLEYSRRMFRVAV